MTLIHFQLHTQSMKWRWYEYPTLKYEIHTSNFAVWSTIRNVSYWCIFNHVTRLYDLIFIKLLCEPGRKGACPDDWIMQQMLRSLDMHVSTGNQIASFPESICF